MKYIFHCTIYVVYQIELNTGIIKCNPRNDNKETLYPRVVTSERNIDLLI